MDGTPGPLSPVLARSVAAAMVVGDSGGCLCGAGSVELLAGWWSGRGGGCLTGGPLLLWLGRLRSALPLFCCWCLGLCQLRSALLLPCSWCLGLCHRGRGGGARLHWRELGVACSWLLGLCRPGAKGQGAAAGFSVLSSSLCWSSSSRRLLLWCAVCGPGGWLAPLLLEALSLSLSFFRHGYGGGLSPSTFFHTARRGGARAQARTGLWPTSSG